MALSSEEVLSLFLVSFLTERLSHLRALSGKEEKAGKGRSSSVIRDNLVSFALLDGPPILRTKMGASS